MTPSFGIALSSFSILYLQCSAYVPSLLSKSFPRTQRSWHELGAATSPQLAEEDEVASAAEGWATRALLFSSWTDGVAAHTGAQLFLKYSLLSKMLSDKIDRHEDEVKSSVEFSPCNGPDVTALNNLELVDKLICRGRALLGNDGSISDGNAFNSWSDEAVQYLKRESDGSVELKFLYIPTAMYALNPNSGNTPGKQKQRARADGKKRRDQVMKFLNEMFNGNDTQESKQINVCAITLDLDDGSLKQPVEFLDQGTIPKDATEAISIWNPHLIYLEGGNTFWLQHCIEKGSYSKLIKDACTGPKGSVYCGKSAGAIVAGNYVETATWKGWDDPSIVPEKETYDHWIGCKGFGFAGDMSFFPHYSSEWEDLVREKTKSGPLSDTTEVLYENEVCGVAGESGLKFVFGTRF